MSRRYPFVLILISLFGAVHAFAQAPEPGARQDTSLPSPTVLRVAPDQLVFPATAIGDTAAASFAVFNDSLRSMTVTEVRGGGRTFTVDGGIPLVIPAISQAEIRVLFLPRRFGRALDTLTVVSDMGEARIALRGQSPFPVAEPDRDLVDFGRVARGAIVEQVIFLNNPSVNPLVIDSLSTGTSAFRSPAPPDGVPPWDFSAVTLLFSPQTPGYFSDTLRIYSNARERVLEIRLEGLCPAPVLVVPEEEIRFGEVALADSAVSRITVVDASISALTLGSLSTVGPVFNVRKGASIVRGNDSIFIPVVFRPRAFGEFTDTLRVNSDGGTATVYLRGKSPYPVLLASVDSLAFGNTRKGAPARRSLILRNPSINALRLDSLSTRTKWFTARARKMTVPAVDSLTVDLTFIPDRFREYLDTVSIAGNSLNTCIQIPLSGNSPLPLPMVGPEEVELEPISLGDTSLAEFSVYNKSVVNELTVRGVQKKSPYFSLASRLPVVLGCRDSIPLRVRFTIAENAPNPFGLHTDTLRLDTDGGTMRVVVNGVTPYPSVETSTSDLDFGTVQKGEKATIQFWLNNPSMNAVRIDSVTLRVRKAFSVTGMDFPGSIKKGRAHQFTVAFVPDTDAVFMDTARIYSNAPGPPRTVLLIGHCVSPRTAEGTGAGIPRDFILYKNYPNPFNHSTTIKFGLPRPTNVSVIVFNTLGQLVAELVNGYLEAGYHTVVFNAGGLSSGLYFYRLQSGDFVDTKKFMILR